MEKLLTFFFIKNISVFFIFKDQGFNDMLTNNIVSFEQLGPDFYPTLLINTNTCTIINFPHTFTCSIWILGFVIILPSDFHARKITELYTKTSFDLPVSVNANIYYHFMKKWSMSQENPTFNP